MIVFKKARDLFQYLVQLRAYGYRIGFVPTMGALHAGHLSLLEAARKQNDKSVCSIFINPTQFNNPADFQHYPVTLEEDIKKLLKGGCDILFLPPVSEIYGASYKPPAYNLGELEQILEGHYRPGHFQGVCQVVQRLLDIVQPSALFLGQKDYQQCMVISRLISIMRKQDGIQIKIEPTLRENDGLAMSSRNLRLSEQQRAKAPALFQALLHAKESLSTEAIATIKENAKTFLTERGFKVDYFEIANAQTLQTATNKSEKLIALVAAHLQDIRLIDNLALN